VNRLQESLKLFEDTMANPLFADTPVFLILNKKDLFEQLIETKPLTMAFPEYTGPQQLRPCIEYIAEQFAARLPPAHSKPMVLLMAARVKKDVQFCFEDVSAKQRAHNGQRAAPRRTRGGSGGRRARPRVWWPRSVSAWLIDPRGRTRPLARSSDPSVLSRHCVPGLHD